MAWTPPGPFAAECAVMHVGRNHEPGAGRYGCYDVAIDLAKDIFDVALANRSRANHRTEAADPPAVRAIRRRACHRNRGHHGSVSQIGYTTASDFDQCDDPLFIADFREESIYACWTSPNLRSRQHVEVLSARRWRARVRPDRGGSHDEGCHAGDPERRVGSCFPDQWRRARRCLPLRTPFRKQADGVQDIPARVACHARRDRVRQVRQSTIDGGDGQVVRHQDQCDLGMREMSESKQASRHEEIATTGP